MKRTLEEFARACGGRLQGADAAFTDVVSDSRTLKRGQLFVALQGPNFNGQDFVGAALQAGAAGAVVGAAQPVALPQIVVPDTQAALERAARSWRAHFAGPLVGVAGSNGKTTAKEMTASILAQAGECLATRGNLNNHIGVPLTLHAPDARAPLRRHRDGRQPRRRGRRPRGAGAPEHRPDHQRGRRAPGGLRHARGRGARRGRDGRRAHRRGDRRHQRGR